MSGGPDDGSGLYPEDTEPCLECGGLIGVEVDGNLVWHYRRDQQLMKWCRGSCTSLEVPT